MSNELIIWIPYDEEGNIRTDIIEAQATLQKEVKNHLIEMTIDEPLNEKDLNEIIKEVISNKRIYKKIIEKLKGGRKTSEYIAKNIAPFVINSNITDTNIEIEPLPIVLSSETSINKLKSTTIMISTASPGCIRFKSGGDVVKFCSPWIPD